MGPRTWFPRLCQRKTDDPTTVAELGDPCGSAAMGGRHEIEGTSPHREDHNQVTARLCNSLREHLVLDRSVKNRPPRQLSARTIVVALNTQLLSS